MFRLTQKSWSANVVVRDRSTTKRGLGISWHPRRWHWLYNHGLTSISFPRQQQISGSCIWCRFLGASIVVVIASAYSSILISFYSESSLIFSNSTLKWNGKCCLTKLDVFLVVFVYFAFCWLLRWDQHYSPVKKQSKTPMSYRNRHF